MDDRRKSVRLQAARERQLAALPQMHGVSEEAVEELKAIRNSGKLRGAHEVFEEEKKAEIFEEAVRHNIASSDKEPADATQRSRRPKKKSEANAEPGDG